jgi:hypothetical protein
MPESVSQVVRALATNAGVKTLSKVLLFLPLPSKKLTHRIEPFNPPGSWFSAVDSGLR